MNSDAVLFIVIGVLIIMFGGEPDLMDALVSGLGQ